MSKFKASKWWYVVAVLVIANFAVYTAVWQTRPRDFGRLTVFDVGQGDAIYFRTPSGNDILIDGGPGDVVMAKLGRAMPFADRKIELLVSTHPHADHLGGLVEVLKRYRVEKVLISPVDYNTATAQEFYRLLAEKNIAVLRPALGLRLVLDVGTFFDVYHPFASEFSKLPKDINDVSIVGKVSLGQSHILLTGDAGRDIESKLLNLGLPLRAEILKVGHQGSKNSSSEQFIAAVAPHYAVISVGSDNTYGHPHEETLATLTAARSEVLRTDEQGDIRLALHPDRVELRH